MSKKKPSPTCCICYNSLQKKISPCECSVCETCWSQIIFVQIEQSNSFIENIACPTKRCQQEPSITSLYKKMPRHLKLKIEQAYFNVYLSQTRDIRRCPSSDCNYAGIVDLSSPCSDNLICNACGTTWRDKAHYNKAEKAKDFMNNLIQKKNEFFSTLWKRRKAKNCPSCQTLIERDKGCSHMTCTRCKHQFCWICLEKHPQHNQAIHKDIKPTIYKLIFFLVICFAMFPLYYLPPVNHLVQITILPCAHWIWAYSGEALSWVIWIGRVIVAVILLSISLNSVMVIHAKVVYQTDYYPEGKRFHVALILICLLVAYFFQLFYWMMAILGIGVVVMVLFVKKEGGLGQATQKLNRM